MDVTTNAMPRRPRPCSIPQTSSLPSSLWYLAVLASSLGARAFRTSSKNLSGTRFTHTTTSNGEGGSCSHLKLHTSYGTARKIEGNLFPCSQQSRRFLANNVLAASAMENIGGVAGGGFEGSEVEAVHLSGENDAVESKGRDPTQEFWLNGPFRVSSVPKELETIHLDEDIVVVNKPSGLLSVPGVQDKDSLATRVAMEMGHYRVDKMVVHRLDQATSGVMVLARTQKALVELHKQFRERTVAKRYIAVVMGHLPAEEGEVDLPLKRNCECPPLHKVDVELGKPSLTRWRVIERTAKTTRVELTPVSGRSHQLRIHMDAIGHPILGDHFYGTRASLAMANRCLLHAERIWIDHPATGERVMFEAPCEF